MAKATRKATTKKAAPKAAKANGTRKAFPLDAKITLLIPVAQNPKRKNSKEAKRYALYRNGMSVAQAYELGMDALNLRTDLRHEYIKIGG